MALGIAFLWAALTSHGHKGEYKSQLLCCGAVAFWGMQFEVTQSSLWDPAAAFSVWLM